jgi:hypothetical protein
LARRFGFRSGLSLAQASAKLSFGKSEEGRAAERATVGAKRLEAGKLGLLARRHFHEIAKPRRERQNRPRFDERVVPSS